MSEPSGPLLPHGGYRKLRSYKVAEAVYDATVVFCRRFFAGDRRMTDQMVQAARSGVRNISEGSGAAATSRKSEMKLTNVARASLSDELLRSQLESQGRAFLETGGFTENLHTARTKARATNPGAPACPLCGKPMLKRTARKGPHTGQPFWGCSAYPDCTGTQPLDPTSLTGPTRPTRPTP